MKKIVLLLVCSLMFSMATCFAGYQKYLNGDRNVVLIQRGLYVIKNSLNVIEYNPPKYMLSIDCVVADMDGKSSGKKFTLSFYYEYQDRRMYDANAGRYIDRYSGEAETAELRAIGEKAFYLAYNIPFYGGYDSDFYSR